MQNLGNRMVTIMDLGDDTMTKSTFKARKRSKTVPTRRSWTRMSKGTTIPVTSEEGQSAPMTCQATDVWVPLKEPARGIPAPVLQAPASPDLPTNNERYPGVEFLSGSPMTFSRINICSLSVHVTLLILTVYNPCGLFSICANIVLS